MKLAIVAGGWHYPLLFYRECAELASGADLFCISHRSADDPIVTEEKYHCLDVPDNDSEERRLLHCDRMMYLEDPSVRKISDLGWNYIAQPNTLGDWGFFNQWLDLFDYRKYDVILNCHDDTYLRPGANVFEAMEGFQWQFPIGEPLSMRGFVPRKDWLLLANGRYPQAPAGYVRGSFEFWRRELLDMLGGRIPIPKIALTREGLTDTPKEFDALSEWNAINDPLRRWMVEQKLIDRIAYLSPHYRVSQYVIEAERGYLHSNQGASWSYNEGLRAYPL